MKTSAVRVSERAQMISDSRYETDDSTVERMLIRSSVISGG